MFVECKLHLCIPTMPSHKCPDPCLHSTNTSTLTDWLFTTSYTIRSGAQILPFISNNRPPAAAATAAPNEGMASVATATANGKDYFLSFHKKEITDILHGENIGEHCNYRPMFCHKRD